jgi:hypothetical protein
MQARAHWMTVLRKKALSGRSSLVLILPKILAPGRPPSREKLRISGLQAWIGQYHSRPDTPRGGLGAGKTARKTDDEDWRERHAATAVMTPTH